MCRDATGNLAGSSAGEWGWPRGSVSYARGFLKARGREARLWAQHTHSVPVTQVSLASLWKNPVININTVGIRDKTPDAGHSPQGSQEEERGQLPFNLLYAAVNTQP